MLTPRGEGFTPKRALIDKLNDITQNYCNKLACRITGAKIFWVAFPTYFKYHFYQKLATCVTLMLPTNDLLHLANNFAQNLPPNLNFAPLANEFQVTIECD